MASKKKSILQKSQIVQEAAAQLKKGSNSQQVVDRLLVLPQNYDKFFENLKRRIQEARVKASLSVNRELVLLYWHIGKQILEQQKKEGWGAKVIERLATDLIKTFPEMKGLSSRNLKYMRAFADAYPDFSFVQQVAAQIPWFHHCILIDKVENNSERYWYIQATIKNGWSRNVLVHQIESGLYKRQGKAVTNFPKTLPAPQSDLAQQLLKDPYTFDFLGIGAKASERDLEKSLVEHLKEFLLELGVGFAFVGQQYHMEIGGKDELLSFSRR